VYVKATKNSSYVSRKVATKIAEMWLNGDYMIVESPLPPETPSRDWIS